MIVIDPRAYNDLCDEINELWEEQDSKDFRSAVARLIAIAESGNLDAAEFVAEILANWGPLTIQRQHTDGTTLRSHTRASP